MKNAVAIGKWIKALRIERTHLTQRAFAAKAGLKQSTISRIENGLLHRFELTTLKALCNALGVGTSEMVDKIFIIWEGKANDCTGNN